MFNKKEFKIVKETPRFKEAEGHGTLAWSIQEIRFYKNTSKLRYNMALDKKYEYLKCEKLETEFK